jgi:hypothetical protein
MEATRKYLPVFPFFIAAGALCAALLRWPYSYYSLLRLGVVGCAWYGFHAFTELKLWGLRWIPFLVAVPWALMRMRRGEWEPWDVGAAAFFALLGIVVRSVERAQRRQGA